MLSRYGVFIPALYAAQICDEFTAEFRQGEGGCLAGEKEKILDTPKKAFALMECNPAKGQKFLSARHIRTALAPWRCAGWSMAVPGDIPGRRCQRPPRRVGPWGSSGALHESPVPEKAGILHLSQRKVPARERREEQARLPLFRVWKYFLRNGSEKGARMVYIRVTPRGYRSTAPLHCASVSVGLR